MFEHIGYPQDRDNGQRPYYQANTLVRFSSSLDCDSTGPIYSDKDVSGGQSDGHLWETIRGLLYLGYPLGFCHQLRRYLFWLGFRQLLANAVSSSLQLH